MDDRFEEYDDSDLPQLTLVLAVYGAIRRGDDDEQIIADAVARGTDAAVVAHCVAATRMALAQRPPQRWYAPGWLFAIGFGLAIIALIYGMDHFFGGPTSPRQQFKA